MGPPLRSPSRRCAASGGTSHWPERAVATAPGDHRAIVFQRQAVNVTRRDGYHAVQAAGDGALPLGSVPQPQATTVPSCHSGRGCGRSRPQSRSLHWSPQMGRCTARHQSRVARPCGPRCRPLSARDCERRRRRSPSHRLKPRRARCTDRDRIRRRSPRRPRFHQISARGCGSSPAATAVTPLRFASGGTLHCPKSAPSPQPQAITVPSGGRHLRGGCWKGAAPRSARQARRAAEAAASPSSETSHPPLPSPARSAIGAPRFSRSPQRITRTPLALPFRPCPPSPAASSTGDSRNSLS